jgi:hypothetical protein
VRVRTSLQVGEHVAAKLRALDYDLAALCECARIRGHACIWCALVRRGVVEVWHGGVGAIDGCRSLLGQCGKTGAGMRTQGSWFSDDEARSTDRPPPGNAEAAGLQSSLEGWGNKR